MASRDGLQTACSVKERHTALEAVLGSATFLRNPRLGKLLSYLCAKSFAGEAASLKEYTIATDVFGRPADFDQSTDAIVRVEMHRLRKKLKEFYEGEGRDQPIEIVIHSGQYAPEFVERSAPAGWTNDGVSEPLIPAEVPEIDTRSRQRRRWILVSIVAAAVLFAAGVWINVRLHARASVLSNRPPESGVAVPGAGLPTWNPIRLLCGRTRSQRDREGNEWGPDAFFQGGSALEAPPQPIYRTRNAFLFLGARSGDFTYKIPLPAGIYELHLYFADTSYTPGISMEGGENTRFFNVSVNGITVLRNFDIIASVGPNTACERVFKDVQPDRDGYLHLMFNRAVGVPLLNGIAILPGIPHRMRPVRISTQDSAFTDKSGNTWSPDNYFLNGRVIAKFGIVSGPVDSQIYEGERYGNFSYAIPAAAGTYTLRLHFAETFFGPDEQGGGGAGDRIFDVYCNGTALLTRLDVFQEAGARHELIKTFHGIEPNAQGNVLVSFVPRVNYAMVSGLELIDETPQ